MKCLRLIVIIRSYRVEPTEPTAKSQKKPELKTAPYFQPDLLVVSSSDAAESDEGHLKRKLNCRLA